MAHIDILPLTVDRMEEIRRLQENTFSERYPTSIWEVFGQYGEQSYVAIDSATNGVVGYIICNTRIILSVAVDSQYRGLGIGTRLLQEVLHKNNKVVFPMQLQVRESNLAAQKLYHRLGFRKRWVLEQYYRDPVENGLLMQIQSAK